MAEKELASWRRVVAIETSSRQGSVAVLWDGERHERELLSVNAHAKDLLPLLRDLLRDIHPRSAVGTLAIDAVITGTGPGSYTGLRIGIATAEGLARGAGAELLGVPSFEAMAHRVLADGESTAIAVDARAARFYFARYRRNGLAITTLREPCLLSSAELSKELQHEQRILGHAGLAAAAGLDRRVESKLSIAAAPSASSILDLGLACHARGDVQRYSSTAPLYLREFGQVDA